MAQLTITTADENVPLIMAEVGRYNAEHGTSLTAPQWAKRILAREVLRDSIADTIVNAQFAADAQLRAQIAAMRESVEDTL